MAIIFPPLDPRGGRAGDGSLHAGFRSWLVDIPCSSPRFHELPIGGTIERHADDLIRKVRSFDVAYGLYWLSGSFTLSEHSVADGSISIHPGRFSPPYAGDEQQFLQHYRTVEEEVRQSIPPSWNNVRIVRCELPEQYRIW